MARGNFEEIFDECLSALLEGRRTIEESLSLYPAWRGRLEPLLRAAEETAAAYDQPPPPYARERGLHRFLEAARTRRRLRDLVPSRPRAPWWSWAPVGAAAVVVIGALAFLTATLTSDGGGALGDAPAAVSVYPYEPPPEPDEAAPADETTLGRAHDQLAQLEEAVRSGESVNTALLWEIESASSDLAAELDTSDEIELLHRMAAVSVASREYELLRALQADPRGFSPLALEASLAATGDVLGQLGATPEPDAEPSPQPTTTPQPTAQPSPAAAATPSPSPAQ
jgi:hypothetical protein